MPKLLRNEPDRKGFCKYALVRLDKLTPERFATLRESDDPQWCLAKLLMNQPDLIEFGFPGSDDEFFTIKLKDLFSPEALLAYSNSAGMAGDRDLGNDVGELSRRAGVNHPNAKRPD